MTETFSEMLRRENEGAWAEGLDHAFLQRWREGRIADADIALYLIQEQRYLDCLFVLLGGWNRDDGQSRRPLGPGGVLRRDGRDRE